MIAGRSTITVVDNRYFYVVCFHGCKNENTSLSVMLVFVFFAVALMSVKNSSGLSPDID